MTSFKFQNLEKRWLISEGFENVCLFWWLLLVLYIYKLAQLERTYFKRLEILVFRKVEYHWDMLMPISRTWMVAILNKIKTNEYRTIKYWEPRLLSKDVQRVRFYNGYYAGSEFPSLIVELLGFSKINVADTIHPRAGTPEHNSLFKGMVEVLSLQIGRLFHYRLERLLWFLVFSSLC
jgi:hypothetical protein